MNGVIPTFAIVHPVFTYLYQISTLKSNLRILALVLKQLLISLTATDVKCSFTIHSHSIINTRNSVSALWSLIKLEQKRVGRVAED